MFCRYCGQQLHIVNGKCSHCGSEVPSLVREKGLPEDVAGKVYRAESGYMGSGGGDAASISDGADRTVLLPQKQDYGRGTGEGGSYTDASGGGDRRRDLRGEKEGDGKAGNAVKRLELQIRKLKRGMTLLGLLLAAVVLLAVISLFIAGSGARAGKAALSELSARADAEAAAAETSVDRAELEQWEKGTDSRISQLESRVSQLESRIETIESSISGTDSGEGWDSGVSDTAEETDAERSYASEEDDYDSYEDTYDEEGSYAGEDEDEAESLGEAEESDDGSAYIPPVPRVPMNQGREAAGNNL
ncbi:MAG: hypothetical protein IJJ52_04300 [Lachnospiraceae bacterium]|nr:hypothetical protein [Lachnospiraceae bacterium]